MRRPFPGGYQTTECCLNRWKSVNGRRTESSRYVEPVGRPNRLIPTISVSYNTTDSRRNKQDGTSVPATPVATVLSKLSVIHRELALKGHLNLALPSRPVNKPQRRTWDGTASWFTESNTFKEWKSNGSLLWVHGNRMCPSHLLSTRCPDRGLARIS